MAKTVAIALIFCAIVTAMLSGSSSALVLVTSKSQTITNFMALCNAHKGVASYESIGKSFLGNDIWAFKFGNPNGGRVLWTAQLHGNEGMGAEILWIWAQWLVSGDSKAQQYMKTNYIMMIPVQNPDSYDRENARRSYILPNGTTINVAYGVNLNRNFPVGWGQYGSPNPADSAENYWGLYGGSEPETQALINAARSFKPKIHVDFHDWGAPLTPGYGDKSLITAINQSQQNYFSTTKPTCNGVALTPYPLKYEGLAGGTWVCQTQAMNISCTSILVELDPATDPQFRSGSLTTCPLWAIQQYYYPKSKGLLLGTLDNTANPTSYGSITIDSHLNSEPVDSKVNYCLTFPNNTIKAYSLAGGVIYKCPAGSYKILSQANNQTIQESFTVMADQNTNVEFQFGVSHTSSIIYQDYFEGAFPNSAWTLTHNSLNTVTQTTAHYETTSHSLQTNVYGSLSTVQYAYITHQISPLNEAYVKVYVRFSVLPSSGSSWCPINLRARTDSPGALAWLELHNDSTNAYWVLCYRNSATQSTQTARLSGVTINANQWYSIEIYVKKDSTAGAIKCWINGALVLEKTGLNNAEWGGLQYIQLGERYSSASSNTHLTYIDDLSVSKSYIP